MKTMQIFEGGNFAKISNQTEAKEMESIRNKISVFSPRSRRRILEKINQINKTKIFGSIIFSTLTYPRIFPTSHTRVKRDLDSFFKRIDRTFEGVFAIWRLEYQVEGGTKRGAPHFHLLLFFRNTKISQERIQHIRKWFAQNWFEVVNSGDIKHLHAGTQVDFMKSWRGVTRYVSKYLAKVSQSGVPDIMQDLPGRFWGIYFREQMPIDRSDFDIDENTYFKVRRIFYTIYRKKVGHKYNYRNSLSGLSVYISAQDAYTILNFIAGET
jgi:hypothetical protein